MSRRSIVERKSYGRWTLDNEHESRVFDICQHVNVVYKGEVRKGWIHRLNPVKLEVVLYNGPTIRIDPFDAEPLETQHW